MSWIDTRTGEVLEGSEDAVHPSHVVWLDDADTEALSPTLARQFNDDDFMEWLLGRLTAEAALEAAVDKQYAKIKAQGKARAAALLYLHQAKAKDILDRRRAEARSKKKSVDWLHGTAGYRTSSRIEVEDEDAVKAWAEKHCPEAVRVTKALRKSDLPANAPGVKLVSETKFYLRGAK